MGSNDIDVNILKEVVAGLDVVFSTKDVSENPFMIQSHLNLIDCRNYHSFVGRALSVHRAYLGIDEFQKNTTRGSCWIKTKFPSGQSLSSSTTRPDHSVLSKTLGKPSLSSELKPDLDLGPQYSGDTSFASRMRKHQSWYRANVLGLPYGFGPTKNSQSKYGNMLPPEDGEAGRNFLSSSIFDVVLERINQGGGAIDPFRLLNNMLSSQPMCFNLFGLLAKNLTLARKYLSTLVPDKVAEVIRVEFEWAPQPSEEYLFDRTAFDAFIEYRTESGDCVGLGIETKLVEPFSQNVYDRPEYHHWMNLPGSPWRPDAHDKVMAIRHNQLWRDHLLAVALKLHPSSPYDIARLLVVYHPEDIEAFSTISEYRKLLQDDDSLLNLSLDKIIESWFIIEDNKDVLNWLLAFKMRYIDLHLSKA